MSIQDYEISNGLGHYSIGFRFQVFFLQPFGLLMSAASDTGFMCPLSVTGLHQQRLKLPQAPQYRSYSDATLGTLILHQHRSPLLGQTLSAFHRPSCPHNPHSLLGTVAFGASQDPLSSESPSPSSAPCPHWCSSLPQTPRGFSPAAVQQLQRTPP